MNHTQQKQLGEVIQVISATNNSTVIELVNTGDNVVKTELQPTYTQLNDNFYKFTYTCPDEDCVVCLVSDQALFLRVGNPGVRYYTYSSSSVDWARTRISDGVQETGSTTDKGYGFHTSTFSDLEYSLLEVSGLHTTTVDTPYSKPFNDTTRDTGTVRLQRDVWQLIAIPRNDTVAEYLVDRLAVQEGKAASDLIEIVSTYRGTDDKFLSYVPGVTSKSSVNNFTLIYNDNGSNEIAGVWVKTKAWAHTTGDLEISWSKD